MELIEAIDDDDIDLVIELLNKGVDVNYQEDTEGQSPLMTASMEGYDDIVDILLNAGADVNLLDNNAVKKWFQEFKPNVVILAAA